MFFARSRNEILMEKCDVSTLLVHVLINHVQKLLNKKYTRSKLYAANEFKRQLNSTRQRKTFTTNIRINSER